MDRQTTAAQRRQARTEAENALLSHGTKEMKLLTSRGVRKHIRREIPRLIREGERRRMEREKEEFARGLELQRLSRKDNKPGAHDPYIDQQLAMLSDAWFWHRPRTDPMQK